MSADLLDLADKVVGWAADGEQVEAVVVHGKSTDVRVYEGEVEHLATAESFGVGVRVVRDNRQGFAYAGTFDEEVLAETIAEARDNASFGTVDEHLGLASPDGVAATPLDLYRDDLASYPTDRKIDLAMALERAVRAADERISGVESADYSDVLADSAVVTSTGIRSTSRETAAHLSAFVLATDGTETKTGFGFSVGREPDDLDVDEAARDAAHRATRLLGAVKPASARVTVVLEPFVTAQLLGIIGSTLSAESVLKGRSLFADRVGEDVGSAVVTFIDDPTDARAFTATETDGEGLATRRNVLIDKGILQGFVYDTYTARRMGTASTASAVRGYSSTPTPGCQAMMLMPGTESMDALLARIDDGVLVQSVSGLHSGVNTVSGDFSTGAEGVRIRDGALAEPIKEFTIASTIQRLLKDVVAVGADIEWLPMHAAGVPVVVADVTVSGN
jgi:PmbA protein